MSKFYITTAIAYTNAPPHIGHALELIQADAFARCHRQKGEEVFFLTGTDEHGTKIARAARDADVAPRQFTDEISTKFRELCGILNISNDDFIRTTDRERHWPAVKLIWERLAESGDLYKKKYEGLYCAGCESFKKKSDLEDGRCSVHKIEPEKIEEENWFFKISKYKDKVKERIADGELRIVPELRKQEILNLIDDAEDVSFSRPRENLEWGIPVPNDSSQTIYVWADALTNYISALGYGQMSNIKGQMLFEKYWPADIHLIGKDILRFHALIWPAILLSAGLELPKAIYAHGFITVDGQKMSKTVGNVIDPFDLIKKYGTDAVRYFLLREIPSNEDGDFSYKNLEARYNSDLANGLGNLAARILTLAEGENLSGGQLPSHEITHKIEAAQRAVDEKIAEFKLHEALAAIWDLIGFANGYVNDKQPWKTRNKEVIFDLVVLLENIARLLAPFMSQTAEKILASTRDKNGNIRIKKGEALFPRL